MKRTCANSIMWRHLAPFPAWFGFTTDKRAFERGVKRLGYAEAPAFTLGRWAATHTLHRQAGAIRDLHVVVAFDREQTDDGCLLSPAQEAGVLAHEASHVADSVFEEMMEKHPGEETRAYLVGAIVQFALDWLQETEEAADV